jgi:endo-1,4-beta-D-glucanase Y
MNVRTSPSFAVALVLLSAACGDAAVPAAGETQAFLGPCALASGFDMADVEAAYQVWKDDLVTSEGAGGYRRVRRPDTPDGIADSTVSEGIAYGMLLAAALDDQPLFDDLWGYAQLWFDDNGLMRWYVDPTGTVACPEDPPGQSCGAATDSDEDMAWALLQADRRWGGGGVWEESYLAQARRQIDRIHAWEVDTLESVLRPGDTWGGYFHTNPSYFAPAYYRVFGEVSGDVEGWAKVVDSSYTVLENSLNAESGNESNGLAPAWCDYQGTPKAPAPDPGQLPDDNFQYDSARIPFRIVQDWCWNGEPRARAYLDKINGFYAAIGADGIVDGYALDGTPRPDESSQEPERSAVFIGCAGAGMMADPAGGAFVDRAYQRVAGLDLLTRSRYYQRSWTVLSLLMMGGQLSSY